MKQQAECNLCKGLIPENGYRLRIYNVNICPSCEERLTNISVQDAQYDVYKDSLKKIFFG